MSTQEIARPIQTEPPRGVLLYVGANVGDGAAPLIPKHERSILVEADPWCADQLTRRFAAEIHEGRVVVVCAAAIGERVTVEHETQLLRRYNTRSGSASVAPCTPEAARQWPDAAIETAPPVMVGGVRLYILLADGFGILKLRTLVTDTQGSDLDILGSLEYWLEKGIETIQCEVDADGFQSYEGLDNHHSTFASLFEEVKANCRAVYRVVWHARGVEVTPDALQYDGRWVLESGPTHD